MLIIDTYISIQNTKKDRIPIMKFNDEDIMIDDIYVYVLLYIY